MAKNDSSIAALERQAIIFAKYYVHQTPTQEVIDRYVQIIQNTKSSVTDNDTALLTFIQKHSWSLRAIDGALALRSPDSEVRRRLYIMFAVLEATPDYATIFLPKQRSAWYMVVIGLIGVRAVLSAIFGMILIGRVK